MLISTTTSGLSDFYGYDGAIRILSEAGFEAFDLGFFSMNKPNCPFNQADYREYAASLRAVADECGIVCNQAHAPFPSTRGDEGDEQIFESIVRSMEIAAIVGAKCIIVHPVQHLYYPKNIEQLKEMNLAFYRRLEPYCEKFNIKVALENMWQYHECCRGHIIHSTCAHVEEFCEYLDALNSPWFVACLDIGHAYLVAEDITKMILGLGSRLQALHVHDTDTIKDLHTLPFWGTQNFDEVTAALAKVRYPGDLTLEVSSFSTKIPKNDRDLVVETNRYMAKVAAKLRTMVLEQKTAE